MTTSKRLILLTISIACLTNCKQTTKETAPSTTPEEPIEITELVVLNNPIDLGEITRGDTASAFFIFKNAGDVPLKISEAMVDCSCMMPAYPESISSGASDTLKVRFVTDNYLGAVRKNIVLKSNIAGTFQKLSFTCTVIEK